jgi:hypothetical protein
MEFGASLSNSLLLGLILLPAKAALNPGFWLFKPIKDVSFLMNFSLSTWHRPKTALKVKPAENDTSKYQLLLLPPIIIT